MQLATTKDQYPDYKKNFKNKNNPVFKKKQKTWTNTSQQKIYNGQ